MTKSMLLAAVAAATMITPSPASAQTRGNNRHELGYFLPRTRVAATVNQLIRRCPTPEHPNPLITTTLAISERQGPDPAAFVRVDARSGFLSNRTTRLGLRPDGTLSSFNASTEGQGGDVLSAVISLGATIASSAVGLSMKGLLSSQLDMESPNVPLAPAPPLNCTAETSARVARMAQVEEELASLRSQVAAGTETPSTAQVMASLTDELSDLVDQLTLGPPEAAVFDPTPTLFLPPTNLQRMIVRIEPIDYEPWFIERGSALAAGLRQSEIDGIDGFRASLAPNRALRNVLAAGDGINVSSGATPYLYYRRPVPATVSLEPCKVAWSGNDCEIDESSSASAQKSVLLPQLSGTFAIRIGSGGIFGTRQAAATFDERGAPLTLEYGGSSGGSQIAGVINAGSSAFVTMRDAETAAINRRLEQEKALRELHDLLEDPDSAGGN